MVTPMDDYLALLPDGTSSTLVVAGVGVAGVFLLYLLIKSSLSLLFKVVATVAVVGAGGGAAAHVLSRIDFSEVGAGLGGVVASVAGVWLFMTLLDDL